ncbi:hypothetical protein K7432_002210 [Basidiobolus ranarum]|uniref:RRN6 beta-propeller domain-containing protein n=1 Tax=Basidiobolus ranarum TaxID=34480 RepID=A0ABR2X1T4_9FUNG
MKTSKPSNSPLPFPLWTWPEPLASCSGTLDFGITGGAFFDLQPDVESSWTFKNSRNSNLNIKAVSSLKQVFPRTRHYTYPNLKKPLKSDNRAVVNYFQANFEDTYVPQPIFEDFLSDTLTAQESQLHYDPFYGNVTTLLSSKLSTDCQYLAFPTGEVGNMLNFSALDKVYGESSFAYKLSPNIGPVIRLTTPIRQLVTSKSKGEESEMMGVRTMSGVTFLTLKERKQMDTLGTPISHTSVHSLSLPTEPIHLAVNPFWIGEAAVMGDKGFLSIWDINSPKSQRILMDVRKDDDTKFSDKWGACEWGGHPRSLVIGSAFDIKSLDLRSPASPSLLYTSSNEKIYGLQRSLDHELQSFFSTTERISIIDHRFASRPLLQWKHNQREPPSQLQVFTLPEAMGEKSCIMGYNRFESEICMYTYERSSVHGAYSSVDYPISLESFSSHPDYLTDELIPPIQFKPNKVKHDERQFQRHPPLSGLACLPYWDDDNSDPSTLFSLFQYAENGSIYSQVYKLGSSQGPSSYIDEEGFFVPGASQGEDIFTQADEAVTELIFEPKADWPGSVFELERQVDRLDLSPHDIKRYTKLDMKPFMKYLASAFLDESDSPLALVKEEDQMSAMKTYSTTEFIAHLHSLKSPTTVYDMIHRKDGSKAIENVQDVVMWVTQALHLQLDWRGIRDTILYPWNSNANQILELNNIQDIRVLLKSEFEFSTEGRSNDEESLLLFETQEERNIFGSQTIDKAIEFMTEALFWSSFVHVPVQEPSEASQQRDSQVNDSLDRELQEELDEITPRKERALDLSLNDLIYLKPQRNMEINTATKALLQEWSIGDAPPEMDHGIEEYMDIRVKSQSRRTFLKNVPATPLTFKGSRPLITKSISQPESEARRNLYFSPLSHFRGNDQTPAALATRSQPQATTPQSTWRTPHIRASQPAQSSVQTPRTILKSRVKRKIEQISQSQQQETPTLSTPAVLSKTLSWESVPSESPLPNYEIPSTPQFTASQPVAGSTNVRKSKKKKSRMSGF